MRKIVTVALAGVLAVGALSGCISSKRQIDKEETGSFQIQGTSWYGFCQGRNAFIYVPGKNTSDPDELEAVIYDDHRCVDGGKDINPGTPSTPAPSSSTRPDTDPDGIVDDED